MAGRTRSRSAPIAVAGNARRARPAARRSRSPRGEGERLRDEILDATERLLLRVGDVNDVSIRMITDAVGVSAPSLYRHFADKDALMFAVCERQFRRMEDAIGAAVDGIEDPVERLRTMGKTYVAFGVGHPEQYRVLLMTKGGEYTPDDFENGTMPGIAAFTMLLDAVQACIDVGAFRPDNALLVATGLWAVVHGVTSLQISMSGFPWVGGDELLEHVLDTATRGLA